MRNISFYVLAAFFYVAGAQAQADAAECKVATTDTQVKEPGKPVTDFWDGEFFWAKSGRCDTLQDGAYWCNTPSGARVLHGYPERKAHYTKDASAIDCFEGGARFGG